MGASRESEIDAWLCAGGQVITASDRAARAIRSQFDRARQGEGRSAWPSARIHDWRSFVRAAWEERSADTRLVLNSVQEQALWAGVAAESRRMATLLEGPRHRLAAMAMEAHNFVCGFAPRFLQEKARAGWAHDAGALSDWLTAFDDRCANASLLSASRLPLELVSLLENDALPRPPLLLAGFDRLLPVQRLLLDAWGEWREAPVGEPASTIRFHQTADPQAELAACVLWCRRQLAANPRARLLVIAQDVAKRRGELERAFLRHLDGGQSASPPGLFEFSLGVPLAEVAAARGAFLLLRWLTGPILEQELDWLFSTGQIASTPQENLALQTYMRVLRRRGLERTHWTPADFISQRSPSNPLPAAWADRISGAQHRLSEHVGRPQSPLAWAALAPQLLQLAGWPGFRPLSSAEFQIVERWQSALELGGSLGFDGRAVSWSEFLSVLRRTLDETLFAPESHDAPIQIAGPAESAGLSADAIWFLGADEDSWPRSGAMHPLLPAEVQRQFGMPHASAQLDWELASRMTRRLLASAPEVHFSYARQNASSDARPSRLVVDLARAPQPAPADLTAAPAPTPATDLAEDFSRIAFRSSEASGGSSVLTNQSQCPFKAFASARLAAQTWRSAEPSLTPSRRGNLLHAVLHAIWAGPPQGIRTLDDLHNLPDRTAFIAVHVQRVLAEKIPHGLRRRMSARYLELEELRLDRLIAAWLDYESARWPFAVAATEIDNVVTIAGLRLKLRLDRKDRLNDGTVLVVDYKTGQVDKKSWDLPRPDDVQLPLYASFALDRSREAPGGLVFAKIRAGDRCFTGKVGDARATLLPNLTKTNSLVGKPLTLEQIEDWRQCIEQLARDFLAGIAEVDPRDYPKTCEYCEFPALCRVQENRAHFTALEEADGTAPAEAIDD